MQISDNGIKFIRDHEGCKYEAYLDGAGIPTICVGHTKGVKMGDTATPAQCDAFLEEDLAFPEHCLDNDVKVPLSQNQYDALCSFIFNVGVGAFQGSTMLRMLNESKYDDAAGQFGRWVHDAAGNVEPGLVTRRNDEKALFLTP